MGKLAVLAIIAGIGYAWYQGLIFAPRKPPQPVQAADPLADMAARLKAEQERLRAEEDARGRGSQPLVEPAVSAAPALKDWQFSERGIVDQRLMHDPRASSPRDEACARARNNVQATSDWMRQGGLVYEKNTLKKLNQNESFDLAARSRQFIEDNCRGR